MAKPSFGAHLQTLCARVTGQIHVLAVMSHCLTATILRSVQQTTARANQIFAALGSRASAIVYSVGLLGRYSGALQSCNRVGKIS